MERESLAREVMLTFAKMRKHHTVNHSHAHIKRSEMSILAILTSRHYKNGLKTTDISRILHLPPSAITPVINHLEEKGMVRRQSSPDDRRIVMVTLTQKGTAFFEKKQAFFFEKALQLVDYLGEEEAKEFLRLFNKSFDFLNNSFEHPE